MFDSYGFFCADELGHMRSELKILEDKNSAYMKSAIDLEEVKKMLPTKKLPESFVFGLFTGTKKK